MISGFAQVSSRAAAMTSPVIDDNGHELISTASSTGEGARVPLYKESR